MDNGASDIEIIDPKAEADAIRRLAFAQALYKVIKDHVSTRTAGNLRAEVDKIMADRFRVAKQIGLAPKSFDIEIDGKKVGTYSIQTTDETPAMDTITLQVEDGDSLLKWAVEHGCASVNMQAINDHFNCTGEVPDGCKAVKDTIPAVQGGQIKRTSLRIDPEKVADSLGADIGGMTAQLLGGSGTQLPAGDDDCPF